MADLATLQVKVVRDGIEQAQKALNDLAKSADTAEKKTGAVGASSQKSSSQLTGFASSLNSFMGLARTFAELYLVKQIVDIGVACLKAAANMEQQTVAFTTMLGSAERAKTLLAEMQSFAASTPFQFTEITDAGKRLIAFGFQAEEVISTLRMLGDVSSGLSQPIGDIVYLYGQIKTQGLAYTQDLMQFANRGVPIYEELAKVLGISTSQVKDFASQGKIGFGEIEKVFMSLTKEGGKFANLMGAQVKTLAGKWSNFNDQLEKTKVILGEEAAPLFSELIDLATNLLTLFNDFNEKKEGLPNSIGTFEGVVKKANMTLDGTRKNLLYIYDLMGKDEEMKIVDSINSAYYGSMEGVSGSFDKIIEKYGEVNAGAVLYANYINGNIDLTKEQVSRLEKIIKTTDLADASWKQYLKDLGERPAGNVLSDKEVGKIANNLFSSPVNDIIFEESKKYVDGGKTVPKEKEKDPTPKKTNSSGASEYRNNTKFIHSLAYEDDEISKINAKYKEMLDRIHSIRDAREKSKDYTTWAESFNAEANAVKQLDEECKNVYRTLQSWEDVLRGSLTDSFIKLFDKVTPKAEKLSVIFADMISQLVGNAINAAVDAFEVLGEKLAQGAGAATAFKAAMASFAEQLLSQLPMMFVNAGLMAFAQGNWAVGLALISMGLSSAFINGLRSGSNSDSTTASAHGNVFGFADGGAFTNGVVNSPTHFRFANGSGVSSGLMGEAGPEAVVPLTRMSNGNLGVASNGSGTNVTVNVINNSSEPVDVQENTGASGNKELIVTIGAIVSRQIAEGTHDRALKSRYNLTNRGY